MVKLKSVLEKISPLSHEKTLIAKNLYKEEFNFSVRTSKLIELLKSLNSLSRINAYPFMHEVLKNENEEGLAEISDYIQVKKSYGNETWQTIHERFIHYSIMNGVEEIKQHQKKVINHFKKLDMFAQEDAMMGVQLEAFSKAEDISFLFNALKGAICQKFINTFMQEILEKNDPNKMNAAFEAFWPIAHQVNLNEPGCLNLWLAKINTEQKYALALNTISPNDIPEKSLNEIVKSLKNGYHYNNKHYEVGVDVDTRNKVIKNLANKDLKKAFKNIS